MKRILLILVTLLPLSVSAQTALLLIDIQEFYFPGGMVELENPIEASRNAKKILNHFRKKKNLIVHVQHNAKSGSKIHDSVTPLPSENVISKDQVNCFKDTDLLHYLKKHTIDTLVICGMQTHMCVEAATRAAHDLDFKCIVIHDACATHKLMYEEQEISAEDVHCSTLNTLKSYAKIIDTETYLKNNKAE